MLVDLVSNVSTTFSKGKSSLVTLAKLELPFKLVLENWPDLEYRISSLKVQASPQVRRIQRCAGLAGSQRSSTRPRALFGSRGAGHDYETETPRQFARHVPCSVLASNFQGSQEHCWTLVFAERLSACVPCCGSHGWRPASRDGAAPTRCSEGGRKCVRRLLRARQSRTHCTEVNPDSKTHLAWLIAPSLKCILHP